MERLLTPAPGPRDRADLTARRVRSAALGGPKKPRPACNALDMPTSVWSEMARKDAEPIHSEKANDDRRQSVDASQRRCPMEQQCISAAFQYCQVVQRKASASHCAAGRPTCLGNRRRPYE